MIETLIFILVFVTVVAIGGAVVLAVRSRRSVTARLLEEETRPDAPATHSPGRMAHLMQKFGHAFSVGRSSTALRTRLTRAGYYGANAAAVFIGTKVVLLVVGALVTAVALLPLDASLSVKAYVVLGTAAVLFFAPNLVLRARLAHRSREVRMHLPDVIDLLEVCVSAGMGLDQAWNSVGDEIRHVSPTLADEMALTNLEMQLGASRADALRHMSDRTGAHECSSLVAMLVQSDRFGTSISEALATFATSMREARSQHAEETAEKVTVKLLFPLVFFIFPVMLIVMVGPTAITLVKVLGS